MKTQDFIFFENANGDFAVSVDDGETLFNHVGRRLPITNVWDEVEDVTIDDLTDACRESFAPVAATLQDADDRRAAEYRARIEKAENDRKRKIALEEERVARRIAYNNSPEGQRENARREQAFNALFDRIMSLNGLQR